MRRGTVAAGLLAVGLLNRPADGFDPVPWSEPGDIPLPPDATSVIPIHEDVPIHPGPSASGSRRGSLAAGMAMPLFAVKRGPGCNGRWFAIGPLAWVCQDHMRFSTDEPIAAQVALPGSDSDGLPFRYYFVARGGSSGYTQLVSVDQTAPDQDLEAGFAVAIVEQRQSNGELYGRSHHGLWIPMRDLAPVKARTFRGEALPDAKLGFGWVIRDTAKPYSKPAPRFVMKDRKLARFQVVQILEEQKSGKDLFVRIDDTTWLHERDVRKPSASPPPAEVGPAERWIDVELSSQTLVAYEGARPVYATLVSTGKGSQSSPFATPKGVHRIWVKLIGSTMDNLEDEDARSYYSIEDVPWVQYFSRGVGLHGAFWHNDFGHVRSHGCVNVSPLDGKWLFAFTGPHVPAGWTAALPTDLEPGTVVRVR